MSNVKKFFLSILLSSVILTTNIPMLAQASAPVPTPVFPYDGKTVIANLSASQFSVPTFRWEGVNGATSYRLEVSHSMDFVTTYSITTVQTAYAPTNPISEWPEGKYYWRVRVEQPTPGGWSAVFSFVKPKSTTITPPSKDELALLTPANDETVDVNSGSLFSWNPVDPTGKNQLRYEFRIDIASEDLNTLNTIPMGTNNTSFIPDLNLPYDERGYYWLVKAAWYEPGSVEEKSKVSEIRHIYLPKPKTVQAISPLTGDTVNGAPVLRWTPVPGAYGYNVWIMDSSECEEWPAEYIDVDSNTYVPSVALNGDSCWKVNALDSHWLPFATSAPMRFTVHPDPNQGSVAPLTTEQFGVLPVLHWKKTAAASYNLQISRDAAFTQLVPQRYSNLGQPSNDLSVVQNAYVPRWLPQSGTYYWRVQPQGGAWSAASSFTVSFPVPQNPTYTVYKGLPLLRWNPVTQDNAAASHYECLISVSPDFSDWHNLVDSCSSDNLGSVARSTLAAGTYYWRVQAQFGAWLSPSKSDWTATQSFTYDPASTSDSLPAPTGLDFHLTYGEEFTWNPVVGAASYRFEASPSPDFGTVVDTVITTGTAVTPIDSHYAESLVYWRVAALDADGNQGDWAVGDNSHLTDIILPNSHQVFLPFVVR